jgi:N-acetyl-gamma-glutamyl-phosphate reductase
VPELRAVVGSNRAELAVHVRGSLLQVFLVLDNIVKGGSGQALQCMNLALGLPEEAGLPATGMGVC